MARTTLVTFQAESPLSISMETIIYILILIPLEILAMILYVKAIAKYDLSLTVPSYRSPRFFSL